MTFAEIIYDVMEIKGALDDDSELEPMWVLHKINQYRAVHIAEEYKFTSEIDPTWLQRMFKFKWTKINAADDPLIIYNSITLGKYVLPRVIKLPDDLGAYRISGSGAIMQFEKTDFNTLMMKQEIGEDIHGEYGYYCRIGDTAYITPYIMEGSAMIIAENPMNIQIYDSGALRNMTFEDPYPLDPSIAQRAIIDFLTKDMAIAEKAIMDIVNDSQSQLNILKDDYRQVSANKT